MNKINQGKEIEALVGELSSKAFLEDFVVPNPMYTQKNGLRKEASDFVVPFGEVMLAYQVKSKTELKLGSEKTETDYQRINKIITKGIGQLKTINSAVKEYQIAKLVNSRGIELPLDPAAIQKLHGLVLIELIGEASFPEDERTALYGGYTYKHEMPIHILRLDDYRKIVDEVDTLPDFVDYLETREKFYEKGILMPLTEELDFLALYKTNPELVAEVLEGKCDFLHIHEGYWNSYRSASGEEIRKRDEFNRPSYVVDSVISQLHTSLGFDTGVNVPAGRVKHDQGTVQNYIAGVTELSKMNRLTRRVVGSKYLERMQKADQTGHGHSLIMNPSDNSAVLVLSTNRSRQERTNAMYNLCAVAYCSMKLARIIGIASEPLSVRNRSYDVIVLEGVEFEESSDLQDRFEEMFGPKKNYSFTEYQG